ncbi:MAG TPA: hypothetical protein VGF74_12100 [Thermoleophilaceae bacterium]
MPSDPTQLPKGVPDDGVDALYGLPLDEFTPARDALAKELRGSGERDAAAWVKALKKPSAAAWVVNQLARSQGRDAKQVLDTGDALRTAQERALAGKGKPGELGGATREHADAMSALLAKAPGPLDGDGHSPSNATLERAEETLRAIALDDEARAGFACGRLTRGRQAAGLGFPLGDAGESAPKKSGRAEKEKPQAKRDDAKKEKERERARKEKDSARAALKDARSRHRDQQKQVADRSRELSAVEREAESIQRKLAKATDALEKARAKESDTEAALEEAEQAAKRV